MILSDATAIALSKTTTVIIISVSSVIVLLIGSIVAFLIVRKKCVSRSKTPNQGQELLPAKKIGRTIPVRDFLQSNQNCVPTSDEFEELRRVETRKIALTKSKEAGLSMIRDQIPLNRYYEVYH